MERQYGNPIYQPILEALGVQRRELRHAGGLPVHCHRMFEQRQLSP
jgi:hypothetical protein